MDEVTSWRWGDAVEPLRSLLRRGGLLAIPTESSYGLAVDPRHERAAPVYIPGVPGPRDVGAPPVTDAHLIPESKSGRG